MRWVRGIFMFCDIQKAKIHIRGTFLVKNLQIPKKCCTFVRFFRASYRRASAEKQKNNPLTCYRRNSKTAATNSQ